MAPATLCAIALVGWMEREEAIEFLRDRCYFDNPPCEAEALAIWEDYRGRVQALDARPIVIPKRRTMNPGEKNWESQFLKFVRGAGANVKSVVKVNLMELVVHQKFILTDRANAYAAQLRNANAWRELALPVRPDTHQIMLCAKQSGVKVEVDIDIPHGEWLLAPCVCNGEFHLKPGPALRHVTVIQPEPDRLLLWSGYHRSYARALIAHPDGIELPALVAFAENVVVPPIAGNETAFDRLVRGPRPPFFADFFDDRLFMRVALRRKRFQMQIRSEVAWIDDP
jgi:hypothetical protein